MDEFYIDGKPVFIKSHAIKRAREREISYPDQVYDVLATGKIRKFGKNLLKITKKGKDSSIICVGEDLGYSIIIKTIERGN